MRTHDGKAGGLAHGLEPTSRVREARPTRTLSDVLERPRYEVFPLQGIDEEVTTHVPAHATVTVTSSPRRGQEATLDLAERLSVRGYTVVPHLAARLVRDKAHLADILDRLDGLAIREAFVIGGDSDHPTGRYAGALPLLMAMSETDHNLVDVGIAGYPEPHPKIHSDVSIQAMWDKRRYATYIVSQMCFDATVVSHWVDRIRRRGIGLPLYLGTPGPTAISKLLRLSRRIGVGESTRFLFSHGTSMLRLGKPGRYTPDRLLERLEPILAHPYSQIHGLHLYTFNDVAAAERWRQPWLTRQQPYKHAA